MAGRKKRILILSAIALFLGLAILALLFLPAVIAVSAIGLVLVILLTGAFGRRGVRRDALSEHQARAAQRGDQSAFLHDRNDNIPF